MRTYENKFWQVKNTSGNGCAQVKKDFDKNIKNPADFDSNSLSNSNSFM